jgi:hypothetical protein
MMRTQELISTETMLGHLEIVRMARVQTLATRLSVDLTLFSEPETRAIRDLIESKKSEIKIVYNFHSYGNFFLHPFGSDLADNSRLVQEYP